MSSILTAPQKITVMTLGMLAYIIIALIGTVGRFFYYRKNKFLDNEFIDIVLWCFGSIAILGVLFILAVYIDWTIKIF